MIRCERGATGITLGAEEAQKALEYTILGSYLQARTFMIEEDTEPQIGKNVRFTRSKSDRSVDVGSDGLSSLAWEFFLENLPPWKPSRGFILADHLLLRS